MAPPANDGIRVLCRIRPHNTREKDMATITHVKPGGQTILIKGEEEHEFTFDGILDQDGSQQDVYEVVVKPVLADVMQGFNGTIFAYGQTGSGKTHTMEGPNATDPKMRGIIPNVVHAIFDEVQSAPESVEFLVRCSLVEIYMEKIRDLFKPGNHDLKVREDKQRGIWIEGCEEFYVGSPEECIELMRMGQTHRAVTATQMNAVSSRSHCMFILTLVQKNNKDGSTKTSKLFLVDLAGSEKIRKTGAAGQTLEEAKMINKSLSSLGNVINALTDGKSTHVPYRDSKLTRILQESLGGNSRTALVINVSPASDNEHETTGTCRFGARAKSVKNNAKINVERSAAELKMLLAKADKEIERQRMLIGALEEEIRALRAGENPPPTDIHAVAMASFGHTTTASPTKADAVAGEEGDSVGPMRGRALSTTFQNDLKQMEEDNAKKEEELVLMQDELDSLREQLAAQEGSEERMNVMVERQRDLEENARNMQAELEEAKYQFEEAASELEIVTEQKNQLEAMVKDLQSKVMEPSSEMDLTSQITELVPELKEQGDASLDDEPPRTKRTPSMTAAEEIAQIAAAAERGETTVAEGTGGTAEQANAEAAALVAGVDGMPAVTEGEDAECGCDEDGDEGDDEDVAPLDLDMEEVLGSDDVDALKSLVEAQHEHMNEMHDHKCKVHQRKVELENEVEALKAKMQKDMGDYAKWKAAVLVDLRTRIDRNIRLTISLDETKERYESMLKSSRDPSKKRLHFLEQSVQCLTKKCQQTQKQLEQYVAESKVNETKILRKNERIKILELLLNDARSRNDKLRRELHEVKGTDPNSEPYQGGYMPPPADPTDEIDFPGESEKSGMSVAAEGAGGADAMAERLAHITSASRVVKPLKGGAGKESSGEGSVFGRVASFFGNKK